MPMHKDNRDNKYSKDNKNYRDNKNNTCTSMSSSMPFLSACSANFLMASASLSWA